MTDTNQQPGNENWLFETLTQLEDRGVLADFCRQIGLNIPADATVIAEGVWPLIKGHYQIGKGLIDVTQASRDLLRFQPLNKSINSLFQKRN